MQLNPARGRKLLGDPTILMSRANSVYAAQPREGTETAVWLAGDADACDVVYAAQPREGTETRP